MATTTPTATIAEITMIAAKANTALADLWRDMRWPGDPPKLTAGTVHEVLKAADEVLAARRDMGGDRG